MPITFELIDIIIGIGICQGLFLSLTLPRISNTNKSANTILSALIIICTFLLIGRFLMVRFFSVFAFQWTFLIAPAIFLFGPLFYLYTKRLIFKKAASIKLSFYHFIPAIGLFLVALYYVIRYTPEDYFQLYRDGKLTLVFYTTIALGIASNLCYLILSFGVLRKFSKDAKERFSFEQNPIKFLWFFLMAIAAIMLAWSLGFLNSALFKGSIKYLDYDTIWAVVPVFIYVIGYFSLKQPELFRVPLKKDIRPTKNRLNTFESDILKKKLDSLMQNEKLFLKNDLTLQDVSETLKTSSNNISWLLNNVYQSTFYDFINGHRIKEFVLKIENKEDLNQTILALSMEVGFNSKSTFNKAFKAEMNDTPSAFIKKHRAA